jgi:hypothetical protein
MIRRPAKKFWSASREETRIPRTIVLKLKTSEFKILTRSYTPDNPPSLCDELTEIALKLRDRVDLGPATLPVSWALVSVIFKTLETRRHNRFFSSETTSVCRRRTRRLLLHHLLHLFLHFF